MQWLSAKQIQLFPAPNLLLYNDPCLFLCLRLKSQKRVQISSCIMDHTYSCKAASLANKVQIYSCIGSYLFLCHTYSCTCLIPRSRIFSQQGPNLLLYNDPCLFLCLRVKSQKKGPNLLLYNGSYLFLYLSYTKKPHL